MTVSELFDSAIWLDYLIKGSLKEKIEGDDLFGLSTLSLFEIKRKLLRNKELKKETIKEKMVFIKKKSLLYVVDEEIADKASEIADETGLGAADALIYATALRNKLTFVTLDTDFRGLTGVRVL